MWRNRHQGFTLLELLVVITLLALVTAVVSVRFGGVAAKARLKLAADQIRLFDAQTRSLARRQGNALLMRIDPHARTVHRERAAGGEAVTPPLHLPRGVSIRDVLAEGHLASDHGLLVGPLGRSTSYAVRLSAQQDTLIRWVIIAGVTGQARVVEGDDESRSIISSW